MTDVLRDRAASWCRFRGANLEFQAHAKTAFDRAIRKGELERQPCEVCGADKAVGHHEDYAEPLNVVWLCRFHHSQRHGGATIEVMVDRLGVVA